MGGDGSSVFVDDAAAEGEADAGAPLFGGVEEVPAAVLDQLKEGGHIAAIFMEGALGEARIGVKSRGRVTWRMAFNATAPILPGFARALNFAF